MVIGTGIHLIPYNTGDNVSYLQRLNSLGNLSADHPQEFRRASFHVSSEHQDSGRNEEGLILPHNFSSVSYLDLAEIVYARDIHEQFESVLYDWPDNSSPEEYFRSYVKSAIYTTLKCLACDHPEDSRRIEIFLWYIRTSNVVYDPYTGVAVFVRLLLILFTWHNDSALVLNLLQTFCRIVPIRQLLLASRIPHEYLRYILRNANRARFNISQFLAENIGMNLVRVLPFCPVLDSLLSGMTTYLEVFVRHGFERIEYSISLRNDMYMRYLANVQDMRIFLPYQDFYDFRVRRHYLILDTFYLLYQFALRGNEGRATDWIRSGHLLFRSIPDSLIQWRELTYMMREGEATENLMTSIRNTYETHFSGIISENYEPRRLDHLSRYTIRTVLRNNFQLTSGIRYLNLPERILPFLHLYK